MTHSYNINKEAGCFRTYTCKRAGLRGFGFYQLRHTEAAIVDESCTNMTTVSKRLGHSDIKTTMRYNHPEYSLKIDFESLGNFGRSITNITTNDELSSTDVVTYCNTTPEGWQNG
jgi:Phage integrase family